MFFKSIPRYFPLLKALHMETPLKIKCSTVPGGVLIHKKWKNTKLSENLKGVFNSVNSRDISPYDFCLYGNKYVIYVPESELVTSIDTDRFSSIDKNDTVIIAVRNTITAEQYSRLQDKLVINSDKKIIPVADTLEIPEVLYQLSLADSTPRKSPKTEHPQMHLNILLNIPGLGKLKAEKLINTFGTINRIASCSVSELSSTLGINLASEVYKYFH